MVRCRAATKPPVQTAPISWDRRAFPLGIALIIAAACYVYWPALWGGFILDDDALITENQLVLAPDGLTRIWFSNQSYDYWPVTNSLFWLEWRLFGRDSHGYHVVSLALHISAALLIWLLLKRLSIPGAFLAALFWAVHPVNVETVAWVSQQKTLLAMVFFLLSILCYLNVPRPPSSEMHWTGVLIDRWYWLSLLCFVLGMLSKGSIAILPLMLLGLVYWQHGRITRWDLARISPFLLIAAVLTYVNIRFQYHGKVEVIRQAGFGERLTGAAAAVWFYLWKALWPVNLVFIYPRWEIHASEFVWWLPLVAAIGWTAFLWWQRGRPWARALLFAWGFFCIALVPVLGFTDVGFMAYSLVADHYQYIALLAVTAPVAAGLTWGIDKIFPRSPWAVNTAGFALAYGLMLLARQQSATYRDPNRLYQTAIERNPACAMVEYNLGHLLFQQGKLPESIPHFERAIELQPEYSQAENNLGAALGETGRMPQGMEHIKRALEINPDNVVAYNNLGMILLKAEQPREAMQQFELSLEKETNNPDAYYGLGTGLIKLGQPQAAIERLRQALRSRPDFPEAHYNLGLALLTTGHPQDAIGPLEEALRLKYREAEVNRSLGVALVQLGRLEEGIERFKRTLVVQPDDASAWANLASAHGALNHRQEALIMSQKALDLARAQGQTALVQQIEAWLATYRAGLSTAPPAVPRPSDSVPP